jgi:hypothetical protein
MQMDDSLNLFKVLEFFILIPISLIIILSSINNSLPHLKADTKHSQSNVTHPKPLHIHIISSCFKIINILTMHQVTQCVTHWELRAPYVEHRNFGNQSVKIIKNHKVVWCYFFKVKELLLNKLEFWIHEWEWMLCTE